VSDVFPIIAAMDPYQIISGVTGLVAAGTGLIVAITGLVVVLRRKSTPSERREALRLLRELESHDSEDTDDGRASS
jgi:hypothetical protein